LKHSPHLVIQGRQISWFLFNSSKNPGLHLH
jgi:hypothetical protein